MTVTRKQTPSQKAFKFFYANAAFSYDPKIETASKGKARCARKLASAERDAANLGFTFEWRPDYDDYANSLGDHSYWCDDEQNGIDHEHKVECCIAYNADGDVVASLGTIIDATVDYRRVIEAELALESL